MNIYIPGGFISICISIYIFYQYNRVQKAKRNERREQLNERRKELLDDLIKSKNEKNETSNK